MRAPLPLAFLLLASSSLFGADSAPDLFTSKTLGFSMQVPAVKSGTGYQLAVFYLPPENNFGANVNVQQQPYPGAIRDYHALNIAQIKQAGFNVLKAEQRGREAVYEYSGQMVGRQLHWYARAVSAPPYVYLVTATALEGSWARQKDALMKSVDSFQIP